MADIEIRIDGRDDGALALIRSLEQSLRRIADQQDLLTRAQNRNAREMENLRRAAAGRASRERQQHRETIQALQEEIRSVRELVRAQREATQSILRSAQTQNIATRRALNDARARIQATREQTQEISRQTREVVRGEAARIRAIQQRTQAELQASRDALRVEAERSRTERARLAAEDRANRLEIAREARRTAEIRRQTAEINRKAQAQALADRIAVQAAIQQRQLAVLQARASQQATNAAIRQARATQQQANAAARARQQAARMNAQLVGQTNLAVGAIDALTRRILTMATVFQGVRLLAGFIREGIRFNEIIETAELGIASLITATSQVRDPFGRMVDGAEALNQAVILAEDQVEKLRVAGIQTAATTEELVQAYESAVAAGIAAGLNLDEIRQVTIQIVQAASAIGLPMQQLEQEVRSILDATIDRNSRVARVLNITNEQVRQHKELGTLQEFLNQKLEAFTIAGERALYTWRVLKSNIQEAFQVFSGEGFEPLFEDFSRAGQLALRDVFDFEEARISDQFRPLVDFIRALSDNFGDNLVAGVGRMVDGVEELSDWLNENKDVVRDTAFAFVQMVGSVGRLLGSVGDLLGAMLQLSAETRGMQVSFLAIGGVIDGIAFVVSRLAEGFRIVNDFITRGVRIFQDLKNEIEDSRALTVLLYGALGVAAAGVLAVLGPILGAKAAIGAALAGVVGLVNALRTEEARSRKAAEARAEEATQAANLIREIERLKKAVDDETLSAEESQKAQRGLRNAMAALIRLGPEYAEIVNANGHSHSQLVAAIQAENIERAEVIRRLYQEAAARLVNARAALAQAEANGASLRVLENLEEDIEDIQEDFIALTKILDELDRAILGLPTELPTVEPKVSDPDASQRALENLRRIIEAEIRKIQAALRRELEEVEDALAQNLISYDEYYNEVIRLNENATARQIELWRQLRAALTDVGDIARVDAEIFRLEEELTQTQVQESRKRRDNYQRLNDQIAIIHARMLENMGDVAGAATIRIEQEFRQLHRQIAAELTGLEKEIARESDGLFDRFDLLDDSVAELTQKWEALREQGNFSLDDLFARLIRFRTALQELNLVIDTEQARAQLEAITDEVSRLNDRYDRELQNIQVRAVVGATSERQARLEVVDVYERQLRALQEQLELIRQLRQETEDREVIEAFEELEDQINRVTVALHEARLATMVLEREIGEAVLRSLVNLFTTGFSAAFDRLIGEYEEQRSQIQQTARQIDQAMEEAGVGVQQRTEAMVAYMRDAQEGLRDVASTTEVVKEAFRAMAADIVASLQQIISRIIAYQIAAAGLKAIGVPADIISGVLGSPPPGLARGGYVTGPGTSTSDSIPARLSAGEYVLRADAVKRLGVDFLDELNRGMYTPPIRNRSVQRFAAGGLVTMVPQKQEASGRIDALIGLEEGLTLKHLQSNEGTRVLVQSVSRNRNAFRSALGL